MGYRFGASLAAFATFATVTALTLMAFPAIGSANPYDISLRSLGRPATGALDDPAVLRYRNLSNEIAIALSPKALSPAETLGMNGFEFALVSVHTPISWDQKFWQGQPGSPVLEGIVTGNRKMPKSLWTPTLHLRKGLPLSTEVGISGSYLALSEMFSLGADAKIAIHESFFRWAPAITMRASFSRLFGAPDLDILTGEADIMTSLPFGVAGMAQITPFFGAGQFYAHINSAIIDETPYIARDAADQAGGSTGSLYNFPTIEWKDNMHTRIFGGVRFIMTFIEVTYEYDLVKVDGDSTTKDMQSHSIKIGFDV